MVIKPSIAGPPRREADQRAVGEEEGGVGEEGEGVGGIGGLGGGGDQEHVLAGPAAQGQVHLLVMLPNLLGQMTSRVAPHLCRHRLLRAVTEGEGDPLEELHVGGGPGEQTEASDVLVEVVTGQIETLTTGRLLVLVELRMALASHAALPGVGGARAWSHLGL